MRVLVTGGAGYIGTELVRKLVNIVEVEEIIIYDNLSRGLYNIFLCQYIESSKIRFVHGDILDTRTLKKIVKNVDIVYHLAAKIPNPYTEIDPHLIEQTNHWGTAELTYAIEESNVQKFIHVSSISVYGSSLSGSLTEESTLNPRTNYGISKMRGEAFVERLIPKLDTYILRCGNVYGHSPSMRFDAVINRFAFEANFHNRISIQGHGKQIRSFIHIDRLTDILASIPFKEVPKGIYNLIEENLSIMDIALSLKEIFPKMEMIFINQQLRMRNLRVDNGGKLRSYFPARALDLDKDLREIIKNFAFHPIF